MKVASTDKECEMKISANSNWASTSMTIELDLCKISSFRDLQGGIHFRWGSGHTGQFTWGNHSLSPVGVCKSSPHSSPCLVCVKAGMLGAFFYLVLFLTPNLLNLYTDLMGHSWVFLPHFPERTDESLPLTVFQRLPLSYSDLGYSKPPLLLLSCQMILMVYGSQRLTSALSWLLRCLQVTPAVT